MIQHDMMMFDHGMPGPDGKVSPEQRREADVNIEFQMDSKMAAESQKLAWTVKAANEKYATDYPAAVGPHMTNTDSTPFMDIVPSISLRENERGAQIGGGWDPHWHQPTDVFSTFSDADFRLGLNAAQTTLGALGAARRCDDRRSRSPRSVFGCRWARPCGDSDPPIPVRAGRSSSYRFADEPHSGVRCSRSPPGRRRRGRAEPRDAMNPILNTGLLIGVLCAVWMFVCGVTGWYKDPALNLLFFLVIPIEIGGLIWGLRQTAREGRNYSQQIVAGTMMAVIAGVVIVAASLAFTTMYPDAMDAPRAADPSATPMSQALAGFIGTLVTGILASAAIAIGVRAPRR